MKICPKCGVQHTDDVEKCPFCNTNIKKKTIKKLTIIIPFVAIYLVGMVIVFLMLTHVICISHDWVNGSCTQAPVCKYCGKTGDEAPGHLWRDATCQVPKTCKTCGVTEGTVLDHTSGEWAIKTPPSLTANGIETLCCTKCDYVLESRTIDKKTPKIEGSSFNFTESEFVSWLNEIVGIEISESDSLEEETNSTYQISNKNGDSGILMLRHDANNDDGNMGGILIYFSNPLSAITLSARIGAAIDPNFSTEAATIKLSAGGKYSKANMVTFMYEIDGLNTVVLVPAEYYNTQWEKN